MAAAYHGAQRNTNDIRLYLSAAQPIPAVPFELQSQITPAVWSIRISSLAQASKRYSKLYFERAWMLTGLLASLILPVALNNIIYSNLHIRRPDGSIDVDHVIQARIISVAIFVGVILFFILPMAVWKFIGHKQMNRLAEQWTRADRMNFGQNASSIWKVKTPGVFKDQLVLIISLPPSMAPSSFHPNAYLPSYINGPMDADANYYYPYKHEPGLPRMSVVGNVPLYVDEKRGFEDSRV